MQWFCLLTLKTIPLSLWSVCISTRTVSYFPKRFSDIRTILYFSGGMKSDSYSAEAVLASLRSSRTIRCLCSHVD